MRRQEQLCKLGGQNFQQITVRGQMNRKTDRNTDFVQYKCHLLRMFIGGYSTD